MTQNHKIKQKKQGLGNMHMEIAKNNSNRYIQRLIFMSFPHGIVVATFLALLRMCSNCTQKPFKLMPAFFLETVNPEQKVTIGQTDIKFNDSPKEQFFFSNLNGSKNVKSQWELKNLESKISISETGNFNTNKVNLWGWKHVISPELFIDVSIKPAQNANWTRTYKVSSFI